MWGIKSLRGERSKLKNERELKIVIQENSRRVGISSFFCLVQKQSPFMVLKNSNFYINHFMMIWNSLEMGHVMKKQQFSLPLILAKRGPIYQGFNSNNQIKTRQPILKYLAMGRPILPPKSTKFISKTPNSTHDSNKRTSIKACVNGSNGSTFERV